MAQLVNAYDDRLYHIDLCILSYHLYHQSLIWPLDPYYEKQDTSKRTARRKDFMSKVIGVLDDASVVPANVKQNLHGPAQFQTPPKSTETNLDPIVTDYSQVDPWTASFVQPEKEWEFIKPCTFITDKIHSVYVCSEGSIQAGLTKQKPGAGAAQTDYLYCFEGATGVVDNSAPTNGAWSLMGFILVRDRGAAGGYDIHITFRGSRSGSGGRALAKGLFLNSGNPDWISDMDFKKLITGSICTVTGGGAVSEGFALSMQKTFKNICVCLNAIYTKKTNTTPVNTYVTGHSLGGALAVMCASALAIPGNRQVYPVLTTLAFNKSNLHLISYSAPTVGNHDFTNNFNSRVNGMRILIDGDPVTSAKNESNGTHVGARILLPKIGWINPIGLKMHEPSNVRTQIINILKAELESVTDSDTLINKYDNIDALVNGQLQSMYNAHPNSVSNCFSNYARNLNLYMAVFAERNGATGAQKSNAKGFTGDITGVTSNLQNVINLVTDNDDLRIFFARCCVFYWLSIGTNPKDLKTQLSNYKLVSSSKVLDKK